MESFRVERDDLRSSSSLRVKGQGLTQLGGFPCIAVHFFQTYLFWRHCSEPRLGIYSP